MANIDLNLIRTFVVLYETRSVTQCAEKLFITQPSVSYALGKLRELFNDRLFVRTKGGMEPTSVATQLYDSFSQSLNQIEHTVERVREFDAVVSERQFTIALTDLGEISQLPLIFGQLQARAPNVKLKVVSIEIDKLVDWLASGKVDAGICSTRISDRQIKRRVLCNDQYVCLASGNSQIEQLTLETFTNARHIQISRALGHGIAEEVMAELGIERDVYLSLPHFTGLPHVLSANQPAAGGTEQDSDGRELDPTANELLAIVPKGIARSYQRDHGLKWFPLPFDVPAIEIGLYWSARTDDSPSQQWFLDAVTEALQGGW
ncbi:LysR family transcriptional regulator [Oceanobacter mangrovi]|uniref:LysR family transcriptional regulator n=1 Tax=Oceanobacter mangrovi TaxID=2862510 RepID=UPI001C8DCFC8|nr:LysR family transcriptional regulator [Oceanobacter mangrovi]